MNFVALWKACCYWKTYFSFLKLYDFSETFTLKRIILISFLAQLFPSPLHLVLLFFEAVIWWFLKALYSASLIVLLTLAHHRKADFMSSIASCLFSLHLCMYVWLRWIFVALRGLSLVAVSGGYSLLRCTGFSLRWLLLVQRDRKSTRLNSSH